VADSQDGRQIDLMNHWSALDRVRIIKLKTKGDLVTLPALSVAAIAAKVAE
jgi:hypothetical protein